MELATMEDFMKIDIRVGEVLSASPLEGALKPSFKLSVDFGEEIGIKNSSAQITDCYTASQLVGKQVLGVVNFPKRQIGKFFSEVLILGVYAEQGVILIEPGEKVKKGDKLG